MMRAVWVEIFQLFRSVGAVILLLLVHVVPFTMLLGSMLAFFLQMSRRMAHSSTVGTYSLFTMLLGSKLPL